jgi:5'-3' exonuclease
MGIKDFQKNLKVYYEQAYSGKYLNNYDHVLVDLNYVLHYCSYGVKYEDDIYDKIYKFFNDILEVLIPTKSLIITSDGVAPLAKIILQRQRRLNIKKTSKDDGFNSIIFTYGTKFMDSLYDKLKKYFEFIEKSYCIDVIFLDNKFDEAELKLTKYIIDTLKINNDDSFIYVTNDSDVLLMLTAIDNHPFNLFIYAKSSNEILSVGKLLDLHTTKFGITQNYNNDFTLINIMLGNDYIPKINLIDFDKLWNAYKFITTIDKIGIVQNNKLNISFLYKLMYKIFIELKPFLRKKYGYDSLKKSIYSNYFDGLTWCFDMYKNGICSRYNFMYFSKDNPNPFGIIFNINKYKNTKIFLLNKSVYLPIEHNLYPLLVLPKSEKHLISKNYRNFVDIIDEHKLYDKPIISLSEINMIISLFNEKYL